MSNQSQLKEKVRTIAREVDTFHHQILIDFIQEDVEGVLNKAETITPDDVGSLSYRSDLLIEIYNPSFTTDILLLRRLDHALEEWLAELTAVNKILGLDPNK